MEVTPPARGWTRGLYRREANQIGDPARAGMDPRHPDQVSAAIR